MLVPERRSGRDAAVRDEYVAILVPLEHTLGRSRDRLEYALVDFDVGEHSLELTAIEAMRCSHPRNELSLRLFDSLGDNERRSDERNDRERGREPNERLPDSHHHGASNFLFPRIATSIPKPAMSVTIDVPPALMNGSGTPTMGSNPETMPALTNT